MFKPVRELASDARRRFHPQSEQHRDQAAGTGARAVVAQQLHVEQIQHIT